MLGTVKVIAFKRADVYSRYARKALVIIIQTLLERMNCILPLKYRGKIKLFSKLLT